MEKLQVLVATMHRTDLALVETMNLRCGAIIANQADREEIVTEGNVKMITTATRGVGLNRNIALLAADGDILLFADDDMVYEEDMPQQVLAAFRENPKADGLVFGIDITRDGKVTERRRVKNKRIRLWNAMRYGAVRIAVRRQALLKNNITFHQQFGGGCPFSAGEDSLFLKDCLDHGMKLYGHPYSLGQCCKDSSSWFVGHNEKYFYDKGVLVRKLFPRLYPVMGLYFALCFKRQTDLGPAQRLRLVYAGIRGGKTMEKYETYSHR
jgi:glycosyltransferase involved in cell wall biosynthesis